MILKRFRASGLRNIENADFELLPGVNLLYGSNAQGKTNAIEGIYLFARGKSFRAREEKELSGFGGEGFRISIDYENTDGDNTLEYAHFGRERRRKKNGYPLKSVKEMMGSFRAVLFYPDDLGLVKDSPEQRRAFLNIAIGQIFPLYIDEYSNFKICLENRNKILKNLSKGGAFDIRELESWSLSMAKYATAVYLYRKDYIKKLELYSNKVIEEISRGKERMTLSYKSDIDEGEKELSPDGIRELYIRKFTSDVEREIAVGSSLFGPQRDDMEIRINGVSARSFASQGQQRSSVLALKLAEGEVCREITGDYPVFLFDDVLSELDGERREYVLSSLSGKQIIITACEGDKDYIRADRIIEVEGGNYRIVK